MVNKIQSRSCQETPLKVVSARLPFALIRKAKKIGKGSLSDGIRIAIESYVINPKDK